MKASIERGGKTVRTYIREVAEAEIDGELHKRVVETESEVTE